MTCTRNLLQKASPECLGASYLVAGDGKVRQAIHIGTQHLVFPDFEGLPTPKGLEEKPQDNMIQKS